MQHKTADDTEVPIKNYYNSAERKFTYLKLEIRKLSLSDLGILAAYAIAIATHFIISKRIPEYWFHGLIIISWGCYGLTTTSPFGLRFGSVYFSLIWMCLCLIFLWAGTTISFLPLGSFLLYQAVRLSFWNRYQKEFVPFQLVRAPIEFSRKAFMLNFERVVSKTEGRGGYKEDKLYMVWLVRFGFLLWMLCLFGIVGEDLR